MTNNWVYLSPHFDDVAFSVGGLVWEQVQRGDEVEIWTIFGGYPAADKPLSDFARYLHAIWKLGDDVPRLRAEEDAAACRRLGAIHRRFPLPDCIYRYLPGTDQPFVIVEKDLFEAYSPDEYYLLNEMLRTVSLPKDKQVVAPLGVGKHRDHLLTRCIAEHLHGHIWHYFDYPYAVQKEFKREEFIPEKAEEYIQAISPQGLTAWKESIACHRSQIALFWKSEQEMYSAIDKYSEKMHREYEDTCLWKF